MARSIATKQVKRSVPNGRAPQIRVRTRAELEALLDRRARKILGISGDEFLRRYKAGELENSPRESALATLACLLAR